MKQLEACVLIISATNKFKDPLPGQSATIATVQVQYKIASVFFSLQYYETGPKFLV